MKIIASAVAVTVPFIVAVGFSGCSAAVDSSPKVTTTSVYKAICQEMSAQNEPVVCLDFSESTPANQGSCSTTEQQAYTAKGAALSEYASVVSAGASISCATNNPAKGWFMSCVLSDRIVRYYQKFWAGPDAMNDCKARAGTPVMNEN